jgi:hypothetical protein
LYSLLPEPPPSELDFNFFFRIARTEHSSSRAWRILALILRRDWLSVPKVVGEISFCLLSVHHKPIIIWSSDQISWLLYIEICRIVFNWLFLHALGATGLATFPLVAQEIFVPVACVPINALILPR